MEELESFLLRSIFEVIKLTLEYVVLPVVKEVLRRPILWPASAAGIWWGAYTDHTFWPDLLTCLIALPSLGLFLYLALRD